MVKIVALSILLSILVLYLKSINSDLYSLALVGSGILIIYYGLEYITNTYGFILSIMENAGLNNELYKIIIKIIAIGYLIEFGAGICEDLGFKSLSDKLILVGKVVILSLSLPIFYALFNLINGLII